MRRRIKLSLGLLVALVSSMLATTTTPAHATDPPGAPRIAVPADDVMHPGSYTEWWYVNVQNPVTKETFIASMGSAPIPTATTFWYDRFGTKAHWTGPAMPYVDTGGAAGPNVCSGDVGCLTYDSTRDAYHLVFSHNGVSADLWLNNRKPGITAGQTYDGQYMAWTNPVATSDVTGWVWPIGSPAPISADGWRGYHDHNYGSFDLANQDYAGWEWGGSHEPLGKAKVMGGVIDSTGKYWGHVVKVDSTGTTFCRAEGLVGSSAMQLSNWSTVNGFAYPRTVITSCTTGGTLSQTWGATDPHLYVGPGFKFSETVGSTVSGSVALVEHFRTDSHSGT